MKYGVFVFIFLFCPQGFCQAQTDTSLSCNYKWHACFTDRERTGYGIIARYCGYENTENKDIRDQVSFGFSRQIHGNFYGLPNTTIASITGEWLKINGNILYGVNADISVNPMMFCFGASLNYYSDFSSSRALSFKPYWGLGYYFLHIVYGWDLFLVEPNFDFPGNWTVGFRFNGTFLEKEKSRKYPSH